MARRWVDVPDPGHHGGGPHAGSLNPCAWGHAVAVGPARFHFVDRLVENRGKTGDTPPAGDFGARAWPGFESDIAKLRRDQP